MACDVMTVRLHLPQIRVLEVVEDTPGAVGGNTLRAIYVTGGYSPTRRGEQPAPTLPRQSRSTR